jgi:hypothetical protein
MGWRSWNGFGCNISQADIEGAMDGVVDTSRALWNGTFASLASLGYTNVGLDDCFQALLTSACHYPGSGVSAAAASCGNDTFPTSYALQCQGLAGPLAGVTTEDACAQACCSDSGCGLWQFCAAGACGGSAAPPNSCYTGAACDRPSADGPWVGRGRAQSGYTFHNATTGKTVVNTTRFPDLKAMTDRAHAMGLTCGIYGNNCFCRDHYPTQQGDAAFLLENGFDTVKYDGCSIENNMTLWAELFAASPKGAGMVMENCHNDQRLIPRVGANLSDVPFHFYRTSTDIRPTYGSVVNNGQSVLHLTTGSGPGCWAYSDMLEVGVTAQILTGQKVPSAPRRAWGETEIFAPGSAAYAALAARAPLPPVLSLTENRAHFSMWSIMSVPLVLSLNFSDAAVVDAVWPIISNSEAIDVNQAWAGAAGGALFESSATVTLPHCTWIWAGDSNCTLPVEQQIYKPLPGGRAAILVMNHGGETLQSAGVSLERIPGLACAPGPCAVRDVWAHAARAQATGTLPVPALLSHDVAYFVLG